MDVRSRLSQVHHVTNGLFRSDYSTVPSASRAFEELLRLWSKSAFVSVLVIAAVNLCTHHYIDTTIRAYAIRQFR